jgi:NAD(P)-dependent dehydrogenase (short-subunit alcohol dehydrogenase family)
MTKAVANHMRRQHLHGSIVNIGSVNGDVFPCKELTAYVVSKAAVMHMTKSLLTEISKHQIRINTINPGPVQSDLLGSPNKQDPEFWKDIMPTGFIANPSDFDRMILSLASNQASRYVTSAAFKIDGRLAFRST